MPFPLPVIGHSERCRRTRERSTVLDVTPDTSVAKAKRIAFHPCYAVRGSDVANDPLSAGTGILEPRYAVDPLGRHQTYEIPVRRNPFVGGCRRVRNGVSDPANWRGSGAPCGPWDGLCVLLHS
jgi:hypothetical protein